MGGGLMCPQLLAGQTCWFDNLRTLVLLDVLMLLMVCCTQCEQRRDKCGPKRPRPKTPSLMASYLSCSQARHVGSTTSAAMLLDVLMLLMLRCNQDEQRPDICGSKRPAGGTSMHCSPRPACGATPPHRLRT